MQAIEHHIQRDILQKLSASDSLRFKDLKTDGLENSIFMYHMNNLIKLGLVEKQGQAYALSLNGLKYVNHVSNKNFKLRHQPKIITILVVQTKDSVALLKRKTQPFIDHYMLPSGKLHFGEKIMDHPARESREKLGADFDFKKRGLVSVAIGGADNVFSHVYGTVWAATANDEIKLHCKDDRFEAVWVNKNELQKYKLLSVTNELIDLVNKNDDLFIEEYFESPS